MCKTDFLSQFACPDVLQVLLENISDGLAILNEKGEIAHLNRKGSEILGLVPGEEFQISLYDSRWRLQAEELCEFPMERHPAKRALQMGVRQPPVVIGLQTPKGDLRWLQMTAAPLMGKGESQTGNVMLTFSDVTEITRSRQRVLQGDENLRLLSQNLPGMIHALEVHPDGRIFSVFASESSVDLYEVTPEQVVSGDLILLKMLDPEFVPSWHETLRKSIQLANSQKVHWLGRFTLPSGVKKWIQVSFNVSHLQGGVKRIHSLHMDVTAKINLENELRVSKERFERAVHGSNSGIWDLDIVNKEVWFSDVCKTMLGYEADFRLDSIADYFDLFHPEDQISGLDSLQKAVREKQKSFQLDLRICSQSREYRWTQVRGNLVYDSQGRLVRAIGWNIDIHEQKTLSRRLELITTTIEEVFWMCDPVTRKLIYVSSAYEKVWKDSVERVMSHPTAFMERVHPEDRERVRKFMERQALVETQERHRIVWPDGTIRWVRNRSFPVRNSLGVPEFLIGVVSDITAEVETSELLDQQQEQVMKAAKMSALGIMAAGVAHEINNPLAIISLRVQELIDRVESELKDISELNLIAESIERSIQRIAKIIRGLRTYARDSEKDPLEKSPVALIVEDALSLCHSRFSNHGIELAAGEIPAHLKIPCRPTQVSQILLNLLNNAFDAVEGYREKKVRVDVIEKEHSVQFRVIDSGPGIPTEFRSRIMQPFFTTKQVGKGTGLGLSIVEGLAKAHHGSVWLDESFTQTCFVVELPKSAPEKTALSPVNSTYLSRVGAEAPSLFN